MTPAGNQDTVNMSQRFRSAADWFTSTQKHGIHTSQVGATSERAVELMHVLSTHFPQRVHAVITSYRDRKTWRSSDCVLADLRDAIARLKLLLASCAGVEISIYSEEDQLTLTPELKVILYSRSNVWRDRLLHIGLEPRRTPPTAVWFQSRTNLGPAPELVDSLAHAVARLGLTAVEFES